MILCKNCGVLVPDFGEGAHACTPRPNRAPDAAAPMVPSKSEKWAWPTPESEPADGCICRGNWRAIVAEVGPLIGRQYRRLRDGVVCNFFGIVHAEDDYYYGMFSKELGLVLLSCVGDIECHGYEQIPA